MYLNCGAYDAKQSMFKNLNPVVSTISHGKPQPRPLLKKSLGNYFNDRIQDKIQQFEDFYSRAYYAPSSEATVAHHEIACLDTKLVHARNTWEQDKKRLAERWDGAHKRHENVYSNLANLNGYYKESFGKRDRSFRSLAREQEQIIIKDREIRVLNKELNVLTKVRDSVENRLEKFNIFKSYLDAAKDASQGEYTDVKELIDRYGILAMARDNLTTKNNTFRETVTKRQKALDLDVMTKSNEVLAYRNYLSELMEYDTILQERVIRLESGLIRIKTTAAQRTLIIGQIKMSIYNLYNQVCKSLHRHSKLAAEDTLGQLTDIRLSIRELNRLSKDIQRMLKAAHLTAKAEAAAEAKLKKINEERQKKLDKLTKKGAVDIRSLFALPPIKPKTPDVSKMIMIATAPTANATHT